MTPEQEKRCEEARKAMYLRGLGSLRTEAINMYRWGYAAAIEREVECNGNLWSTLFVNAIRLPVEDQERLVGAIRGELSEGWRPIASAPKGGTHESPVSVLLWADGLEAPVKGVLIGEHAVSSEARGYDFTHWQPLPEPPKEGEE